MVVGTPLPLLAEVCGRLAAALPTMGEGFSFVPDHGKGIVKVLATGWSILPMPGGCSVMSPVDVYAGKVSDSREFWRVHDGFIPYGQLDPIVMTTADLAAKEQAAREADSLHEKEAWLRFTLGERRSYGSHTVNRS